MAPVFGGLDPNFALPASAFRCRPRAVPRSKCGSVKARVLLGSAACKPTWPVADAAEHARRRSSDLAVDCATDLATHCRHAC
jgi:hypothetical protein